MIRFVAVLCFAVLCGVTSVMAAGSMGRLQRGQIEDPQLQPAITHAIEEAEKCVTAPCPLHKCEDTSALAGIVAEIEALVRAVQPYLNEARQAHRQIHAISAKGILELMERERLLKGATKASQQLSDIAQLALVVASAAETVKDIDRLLAKLARPDVSAKEALELERQIRNLVLAPRQLADKTADIKDTITIARRTAGYDNRKTDVVDGFLDLNSMFLDLDEFVEKGDFYNAESYLGMTKLIARLGLKAAEVDRAIWAEELAYLKAIAPQIAAQYEKSFANLEDVVALDAGLTHLIDAPSEPLGVGPLTRLRDALLDCPCGSDVKVTLPQPSVASWGPALVMYGDLIADALARLKTAARDYSANERTTPIVLAHFTTPPEYQPSQAFNMEVDGPKCALAGSNLAIFPAGAPDIGGVGGGQQSHAVLPFGGDWSDWDELYRTMHMLTELTAPQEDGDYEVRLLGEKRNYALAVAPFRVKGTPFRIVKVEAQPSPWAPNPTAKWVDLVVTYEGRPKGDITLKMEWSTCPPNAECHNVDVAADRVGDNQVKVERFGFCVKLPGMPETLDNKVSLVDSIGKQTEFVSSGVDCRKLH